jgi:hypothetical protein
MHVAGHRFPSGFGFSPHSGPSVGMLHIFHILVPDGNVFKVTI